MKKIAIVRCHAFDNWNGDEQLIIAEQDCYELEDEEAEFILRNIFRLYDRKTNTQYKALEFLGTKAKEPQDVLARLRELKRLDDAAAAEKKAAAVRQKADKAKEIERKRKQLEKLKKELGE